MTEKVISSTHKVWNEHLPPPLCWFKNPASPSVLGSVPPIQSLIKVMPIFDKIQGGGWGQSSGVEEPLSAKWEAPGCAPSTFPQRKQVEGGKHRGSVEVGPRNVTRGLPMSKDNNMSLKEYSTCVWTKGGKMSWRAGYQYLSQELKKIQNVTIKITSPTKPCDINYFFKDYIFKFLN